MTIKPLQDRVLIAPAEAESYHGKIALPEGSKTKPTRGVVISVGPGKADKNGIIRPVGIKTGETVAYAKFTGCEFEMNGKQLILLREDEIWAVLT